MKKLDILQKEIDQARTETGQAAPNESELNEKYAMGQTRQLAIDIFAGAFVGCVGGYFIDRWAHTSPIFIIVGFFIGFAAGVYNLIRQSNDKSSLK
jgi:ATP synthase protein I